MLSSSTSDECNERVRHCGMPRIELIMGEGAAQREAAERAEKGTGAGVDPRAGSAGEPRIWSTPAFVRRQSPMASAG